MRITVNVFNFFFFVFIITCCESVYGQENVELYSVHEITFKGEYYKSTDNPVRDVEFYTLWQHESGYPEIRINGFFDADGDSSSAGNTFKIRFCPVKTGKWTQISVRSNDKKLNGQNEGIVINAIESLNKGFWEVDKQSNGSRWYNRSNGEHQYIIGNTLYSFLSESFKSNSPWGNIKNDVLECAKYYNKIRFALTGDIFPNPEDKPFLDEKGVPTDDGNFSYRPNPVWFQRRVDLAVDLCYQEDIIADLILNGPDSENGRSNLKAMKNNGDYLPWLRYIAARYGSYPNVWFCISNEYDIRRPSYSKQEIVEIGTNMQKLLPYLTPLSVHANNGDWSDKLNGNWFDHIIVQNKIKKLDKAAECITRNYYIGGKKPVINDELAYEGKADGWSEEDVISALLGAFVGGGYASTGYKSGPKTGHYFAGKFDATEHTASDNLLYLREIIDNNITFWKMAPDVFTNISYKEKFVTASSSIFHNINQDFCALQWLGNEYVLATNKQQDDIVIHLPQGNFNIATYDLIKKEEKLVLKNVSGRIVMNSVGSKAGLIHVYKSNK